MPSSLKVHEGDRRQTVAKDAKGRVAAHQFQPALARKIEIMSAQGVNQDTIAYACDVSVETLVKHYREHLEKGAINANSRVAAAILNTALGQREDCKDCDGKGGTDEAVCEKCGGTGEGKGWVLPPNTTAQIWWSKNRMNWTDKERIEHVGDGGGPVITEQRSSADAVRMKLKAIRDRTANDPSNKAS